MVLRPVRLRDAGAKTERMEVGMSALSLDDRKNPGGVLHYAPRRLGAVDDESTIRPVLERLSRGEGRTPAPRMIRKSGGVAAMPPVEFETAARNPLPIAARLAVAGGLMALVAALGAGLFIWPRSADHAAATTGAAPSTATNLPTPVHTVSIRESDKSGGDSSLAMIDKDPARAPQMTPATSVDAGAAAPIAAPVVPAQPVLASDPSATPLKLWAMMPADPSSRGWTPAGQQAMDQTSAADTAAAPAPETAPPPHKTATTHNARHVVHRQRKSHRRRHVSAAPAPAQTAEPAQADQAQPQPIKKLPLQAAIDRIFSSPAGAANGAAPATTP
jgi:hypothetical protein